MASSFVRNGKKIVAIGRNYAAHAKELSNAVPKEPFFFIKPTSSYLLSGGKVEIPQGIIAHHEVELGLVIGKGGRDISQVNAESHIAGYSMSVLCVSYNSNKREEVSRLTAHTFYPHPLSCSESLI